MGSGASSGDSFYTQTGTEQNRKKENNGLFNGLLGALHPGSTGQKQPKESEKLEYLFEDEYVAAGPSWGARICYGTGMTYITALGAGGLWGLADGLRNAAGSHSARLRLNCVLNGVTARGPFLGNNVAMLALLYNLIHGGVIKMRKGEYDVYSSVGSATLAGLLYKSTRGPKSMAIAGGIFGSAMAAYQLGQTYWNS